ncbi:MarR family winged helix-turn-helix transcriptional regulator [Novosphingobium terrae]|uniref:MarR family winged helix-turn-helix transcriptional regulator n=1 Tax=Novosphingobium terrae TaxID=2726189 RepID=UPI0019818E61|nr:MarR family winged helix-turn-helix transcriptional regulator [Novosphingobium terrae]
MHQRLCVCTTMRRATRALTRAYDEALAPFGITVQQFAILRDIQRAGTIPLPRLAEGLVMDRTSLYRALPPLEREGLLVLESPSPRSRTATLTPAGQQRVADANPAWESLQTRILSAMQPGEWDQMQSSADRLATQLVSGTI